MNTKLLFLISATTLSSVFLLVGADSSRGQNGFRDRDEASRLNIPSEQLGDLRRANNIIGREVVDDHDQKLGRVKDLALDLQNGRIAEVIVATSGALGMDQKLVALPPSSFECDRTMKTLRFKADKVILKNSPEFNVSQWNQATQYIEVRETYQRFDVPPYFVHDQQAPLSPSTVPVSYSFDGQKPLPRLGFITRASHLIGTTALNSADERLGKVDDLVLDLPAGRVVEVVLSTGGVLGVGISLRAVPPEAFHWNNNNTLLTLKSTSEAFREAPHFKPTEWGYALEPASIGEVYDVYHVQPYFITRDLDLGAETVRARVK